MKSPRRTRGDHAGKGDVLLGLLPSPIGRRKRKTMIADVGKPTGHTVRRMDGDEAPATKAPRPEWAIRASLLRYKQRKPKIGPRKRARAAARSEAALPWIGLTFEKPPTPSPTSESNVTRSSSSTDKQREAVQESTVAGDGPTRHFLVFSGLTNLLQAEPVGRIPGLASTPAPAEPFAPTRDCATTPAPGGRVEIDLGLAIAPGLAPKRATDPAIPPPGGTPKQQRQQQREQSQPTEAATEQLHESIGPSPGSSPAASEDPAGPADELNLRPTAEPTGTVATASAHSQAELNLSDEVEPAPADAATLAPATTAHKRARFASDASAKTAEIDLTGDEHESSETPAEPKRKQATHAAPELVLGSISDDSVFQGVEEIEANKIKQIFDTIMREMPAEWRAACCGEGSEYLPAAGLEAVVRKAWRKVGLSPIRNALRAMRWHKQICDTHPTIPIYPVPASICAFACEEYDAAALERGAQREKKAEAAGREPQGRGGATASSALRNGYWQFEHLLKLKIEASDPMVKAICAAGGGMPKIRTMLPFEALWLYPRISTDAKRSKYVRAYAAAAFIGVAGSLRVIDQQRTGSLHFEKHEVLGESVLIACGTTRKSKAGNQSLMKPLAWRAPLVALTEVDCGPLLESMPRKGGSMYRDFIVPAGFTKVITNAIGWADRPASHETVVASQRALLSPFLGDARTDLLGGHDQRHTIPEVARGLNLPRHVREALGYWRARAIVADTTGDKAAMARAVTVARGVKDRSGALASNADRYSSVDGAPVESDTARVTCLKAALCVIRSERDQLPTSTRQQIQKVADLVGVVPGEP